MTRATHRRAHVRPGGQRPHVADGRLLTEVAQLDRRIFRGFARMLATRHRPRRAGRRARSRKGAGTDGTAICASSAPRLRVATDRVSAASLTASRLGPRRARPRRSGELDDRVRRMLEPQGGPGVVGAGVHGEDLAAVVENRDQMSSPLSSGWPTSISQSHPSRRHCSLKIRRRLAGQPNARRERSRTDRTSPPARDRRAPGDEEGGHFRRERGGCGGKRVRSSAVILRIVSEPAFTCFSISSSLAWRFVASRSA